MIRNKSKANLPVDRVDAPITPVSRSTSPVVVNSRKRKALELRRQYEQSKAEFELSKQANARECDKIMREVKIVDEAIMASKQRLPYFKTEVEAMQTLVEKLLLSKEQQSLELGAFNDVLDMLEKLRADPSPLLKLCAEGASEVVQKERLRIVRALFGKPLL